MGTIIKVAGLDAESASAAAYISPVSRGLEAIHFLNGSAAKIIRNYALGKEDGALVGTPVAVNAGFADFSGISSGVLTSMSEPLEGTFFIVCKTTDDGASSGKYPSFFSSVGGKLVSDPSKSAPGIGLWNAPSLRFAQGVMRGDGTMAFANNAMTATATETWALYVCVLKSTAFGSMTNKTTGVVAGPQDSAGMLGLPRARSDAKIKLGQVQAGYTGNCQIAAFQGHSVVLSDAEIEKVVKDIRSYVARKGITV